MVDLAPWVRAAPRERAAELAGLLRTLALPSGRLSEDELGKVVRSVADRPELFEDLVVDDLEERWWMMLHREANFDVAVLSWEREQSSDWHDHGGSSGAFAVIAGVLLERYRLRDGVSVASRHFIPGADCTFGPGHVHDVVYAAGSPAVSIHAYSPPLTGLTMYDRTEFGFVARAVVPEDRGEPLVSSLA